jgi:hypothetical protein
LVGRAEALLQCFFLQSDLHPVDVQQIHDQCHAASRMSELGGPARQQQGVTDVHRVARITMQSGLHQRTASLRPTRIDRGAGATESPFRHDVDQRAEQHDG